MPALKLAASTFKNNPSPKRSEESGERGIAMPAGNRTSYDDAPRRESDTASDARTQEVPLALHDVEGPAKAA